MNVFPCIDYVLIQVYEDTTLGAKAAYYPTMLPMAVKGGSKDTSF